MILCQVIFDVVWKQIKKQLSADNNQLNPSRNMYNTISRLAQVINIPYWTIGQVITSYMIIFVFLELKSKLAEW